MAVTESRIECAAAVVTPAETRRRTKSRREIPLDSSCATRLLIAILLRGPVSLRSPHAREIAGHGADVVLRPESTAPNHPVHHAVPSLAILPQRGPHAHRVALGALACQDVPAREIRQRRYPGPRWNRCRRIRSEMLAKI